VVRILKESELTDFHSPQAWSPAGDSFGMADLLRFAGAVE